MLDIGWSELLMVAIVAIVVVGPKELPKLMRTFGFYAGKVKRTAADFHRQFNEAMAESEGDEVRKNIEAIRANMGTAADFDLPKDKPLMTPMAEAPRNTLGDPPLGDPSSQTQENQETKNTKLPLTKEPAGGPVKRAKPTTRSRAKSPAKSPAKSAKTTTAAKRVTPAKGAGDGKSASATKSAGATKTPDVKPRKSSTPTGSARKARGKGTMGPKT